MRGTKEAEESMGRNSGEQRTVLDEGIDYSVYHMSLWEKLEWFIVGAAATAAVMYVFYERWYVSLIVGIIGGIVFVPVRNRQIIEKRKRTLSLQFKELLESVKSSLGSETVYDAFMKAKGDLAIQFAEDAYIMQELTRIMQGTMLKEKLEDLLMDFAERSDIEDIRNFAAVFKTCYRRGGNIQEIVSRSISIINEKIEVNMDIETMIAGQKNEQNILLVLPVVFVVMLKAMGGMVDLESAMGIISMTIAIVIFLAACAVSKKIMKIDV